MVRLTTCLVCCLCCTAFATASNPDQSTGTMTRRTKTAPRVDPRANVMQFPKRLLLNAQLKAEIPDLAPLPMPIVEKE